MRCNIALILLTALATILAAPVPAQEAGNATNMTELLNSTNLTAALNDTNISAAAPAAVTVVEAAVEIDGAAGFRDDGGYGCRAVYDQRHQERRRRFC